MASALPYRLKTVINVDRLLNRGVRGSDVLARYHNVGIGKTIWHKSWKKHILDTKDIDCYWIVTRARLKKRKGPKACKISAWGIKTWKGKLYHNGEERRIHGINKVGWRIITHKNTFERQKYPKLSPSLHEKYLESLEKNELNTKL